MRNQFVLLLLSLLLSQQAISKEITQEECRGEDYRGIPNVEIITGTGKTVQEARENAFVGHENVYSLTEIKSETKSINEYKDGVQSNFLYAYRLNQTGHEIENYITRSCKEKGFLGFIPSDSFRFTAIFDKRDIIYYRLPEKLSWMNTRTKNGKEVIFNRELFSTIHKGYNIEILVSKNCRVSSVHKSILWAKIDDDKSIYIFVPRKKEKFTVIAGYNEIIAIESEKGYSLSATEVECKSGQFWNIDYSNLIVSYKDISSEVIFELIKKDRITKIKVKNQIGRKQ